jgi:peptide methionine sulfoxide reductase MsrA
VINGFCDGRWPEELEYDLICSGMTGWAQCVQVWYEPDQISYETLLQVYWKIRDEDEPI